MISIIIQREVRNLIALGRKILAAQGDARALDARMAEFAGLLRNFDMVSVEDLREVRSILDALPPRDRTRN